ncbi:MAG: histidine phosphatase family protein [Hyphomicrobiaceae bacterium]
MNEGVTLYFLRHGETEWNFARRIQGQTDTDLNDTGRAQAAGNAIRLREMHRDLAALDFIASPLRRCRQTMEIVRRELAVPRDDYLTDERLMEIHFGHWQGKHWPDVAEFDPEGFSARQQNPFHWRPTGGESYADLAERVSTWLAGITRDSVVVSHGGVSRALRGLVFDLDPAEITELRVPQDKVLVINKNEMNWV